MANSRLPFPLVCQQSTQYRTRRSLTFWILVERARKLLSTRSRRTVCQARLSGACEYREMVLRNWKPWLYIHLPKVAVGIILVAVSIWNLKDIIAPGRALLARDITLRYTGDDCPPTLRPFHEFIVDPNHSLTARLWFPSYDNSICKITAEVRVPEGRSISIDARKASDLSPIPLTESKILAGFFSPRCTVSSDSETGQSPIGRSHLASSSASSRRAGDTHTYFRCADGTEFHKRKPLHFAYG